MALNSITMILWIIWGLLLSQGSGRICHTQCSCAENVIHCFEDDNIYKIPEELDPTYTKLIIEGGSFGDNVLTRNNLTGLKNIIDLRIIYTNIHTIESHAFSELTNLRELDLSFNKISKINSKAFNNLNLKSLKISNQNLQSHLSLLPDSFEGLRVNSLALRQNDLNDFKPEVFQPIIGLRELFLSKNNIKSIPSNSYIDKHFNEDDRLLDLTDNPLKCDCSLDWLAKKANVWSKNARDLNITCRYEEKNQYGTLTGRHVNLEIAHLTAKQLCPKTDIQTIEVNLDHVNDYYLILKCTAISRPNIDSKELLKKFRDIYQNNNPFDLKNLFDLKPPNLSWSYNNNLGNEIVTMKKTPMANIDFIDIDKSIGSLDLNVTLKNDLNGHNFTCTAWGAHSDEQKILINLSGLSNLKRFAEKPKLPFSDSDLKITTEEEPFLLDEKYNLFRKQFTLIEMFGAISGTFLVTLICLLAGSRCIQIYCRDKTHGHFHYSSEPSMISDTAKKDHTVLIGGKNYTYSGSTLTPITTSSNAPSANSTAQSHFMQLPNGTLPQTPQYLINGPMQNYQNFPDAKNMTLLGPNLPQNNPQITPNLMAAIWAAQQHQSQSNSSGSGPYSPSTMTGHEYDIPRSIDFNALTLPKNH